MFYLIEKKKQFLFFCVCMFSMRGGFDLIILCRMISLKILLVVTDACFIVLK